MRTKLFASFIACASAAFAITPYAGISAGYLTEGEVGFYAVRAGAEFATTGDVVHSGEIEVGFAKESDLNKKLKVVPLLINYRATLPFAERLALFAGGGIGTTRVRVDRLVYWSDPIHLGWSGGISPGGNPYGTPSWSTDSANAFSAQGFAGVEARVSERLSVSLGYRYLWIGDPHIVGVPSEFGHDNSVEAGITLRM